MKRLNSLSTKSIQNILRIEVAYSCKSISNLEGPILEKERDLWRVGSRRTGSLTRDTTGTQASLQCTDQQKGFQKRLQQLFQNYPEKKL